MNLLVIFILTFLGVIGGQGFLFARRFIYPFIVTIYVTFLLQNFWAITVYFMVLPLILGYGTPDLTDKGSALGRFFYKLFKSEVWVNILTRGTVGLLISLSLLSIPIITKNWTPFLVGSSIIILVWSIISWRGFGVFKIVLLKKEYLIPKVDIITYAVTSCAVIGIIIKFASNL